MNSLSKQTKEQAISVFRSRKVLSIKDLSEIIKNLIVQFIGIWSSGKLIPVIILMVLITLCSIYQYSMKTDYGFIMMLGFPGMAI